MIIKLPEKQSKIKDTRIKEIKNISKEDVIIEYMKRKITISPNQKIIICYTCQLKIEEADKDKLETRIW